MMIHANLRKIKTSYFLYLSPIKILVTFCIEKKFPYLKNWIFIKY